MTVTGCIGSNCDTTAIISFGGKDKEATYVVATSMKTRMLQDSEFSNQY